MRKKVFSILLAGTMIIESVSCNNLNVVSAIETEKNVVSITSDFSIADIEPYVSAVILEDRVNKYDKDMIIQLLDDGLDIVVLNDKLKTLEKFLGAKSDCNSINSVAYELKKDGENVVYNPIGAEILYEEGQDVVKNDFEELSQNFSLSEGDVEVILESDSSSCHLDGVADDKVAYLQAKNDIGKAYVEASRTTYYYRKHWYNTDTAAEKKGTSVSSSWSKMGYSTVTLAGYNIGGKGKKCYDAFWSTILIGALNNYKLKFFTAQTRLYNQNSCSIIDKSILKGGSKSTTVSVGAGLGATESGISPNISGGYSYSYDPDGLYIDNISGDSELQPNWVCEKKSPKGNESYKLNPMIIVKSPKGTEKETKVSARVKNLFFEGNLKSYKVANATGGEYVNVVVKNHKKVSKYQ